MYGGDGGDSEARRGLRHAPPAVEPGWILRPQLQRRLARRFQVTVVEAAAPAGYGKTTALARALHDNLRDPVGTDLWVQCGPHDGEAAVLARAILTSIGLEPPTGDWSGDGSDLADALLRFAPHDVCLVLDDVHLIEPGSSGMALLQQVVDALPSHAHVLLAGRSAPPLQLARLRVEGRCESLGLADFEFDADEADLASGGASTSDLARWPAMSRLLRDDRPDASADYLLEEVATALGPDRLAALTALSCVREVDDGLATAATDRPTTAAALVAELPLVLRSEGGTFQMHDLWHAALVRERTLAPGTTAALSRLAEEEVRRGRHLAAAELFALADDGEGVERSTLEIVSRPMISTSAADLRMLASLVERRDDPLLTALVRSTLPTSGDEGVAADAFSATAAAARAAGHEGVEVVALQNEINLRAILSPHTMPRALIERIEELAAGSEDPRLRPLRSLARMFASMSSDDSEEATRYLTGLRASASPFEGVILAFALSDLGRPEEVATPDPAEGADASVSRMGGQYLAQAMWLRGDVPPELALELGTAMAEDTSAAGMVHVRISTSSVFALVAVAAGDVAAARRHADAALGLVSETGIPSVRAFAAVADAATVLLEQGEAAALRRVAAAVRELPIGRWPARPYLYCLPLVHLAVPEARPALEGFRLGPALTAARDAGVALVALREHGEVGPARRLPWHRPWLLRAHVLPPHLVELAAAVAEAGEDAPVELIDQIPQAREHLLAVAGTDRPGAAWAGARAAQLAARPDQDVVVSLLGPVRCRRGGVEVGDAGWVRRDRVRQLLAFLLLHRRIARRRVAEALWPDLAPTKAAANLRVTLTYLHKVLEPQRRTDERPWFIRSDAEHIEVHAVGLEVDAEEFERLCRAARRHDDAGRGTMAIATLRQAVALYRGDYAGDWPEAEWAQVERLRLHALAVAAMTRLGELLLARGEPEDAGAWAARVIHLEPLDEAAHRLLARTLAAQGNRAGAARALGRFRETLESESMTLEAETARLADSYRAGP